MSTSARVTLNAVSNYVTSLITAVIGFVLVPLYLDQLGRDGYGLTTVLLVIVSWTMLADLGLRGALGRNLAAEAARKNIEGFNKLVSSARFLYLGIGLTLAVACSICAPLLANLPMVTENITPEARPRIISTATMLLRWYTPATIIIVFFAPVYAAVITSNDRFDLQNYISSGKGIFRGVMLLIAIGPLNAGLYGWAAVMLGSDVLELLALGVVAHRVWPALSIHLRNFRWQAIRPLFALGGYLYAMQISTQFSVQSCPLIITYFMGLPMVALYNPGLSIAGMVRPLVETLSNQLHPLATAFHVTGKTQQLQAVLIRGTRYTLLMGIAGCVVLGVFADPIMRIWLGRSLGEQYITCAHVLICWVLVDLFNYAGGSQGAVLLGMNRLKFVVWTQLPFAFASVIASVLLVKYASVGVVGVIIPSIVVGMLRRPILSIYTARVCGMGGREYFRQAYARPLIVGVLLLPIALGLLWLVRPGEFVPLHTGLRLRDLGLQLLPLLGCLAATAVAWGVLAWTIGFTHEDRLSFRNLASRVSARIFGRAPAA